MKEQPLDHPEATTDLSPEARRQDAIRQRRGLQQQILEHAGPGTRFFTIVKRVVTGAYNDGFIHAGNLAYMAILALFPFFIALAAIFSALGEQGRLDASIAAVLTALPYRVAQVLGPVVRDVVEARQGWLLWIGGLFGLWTAGSLVETIRDILHRAYGTPLTRAFWRYRLASTGVIVGSVFLLLVSLSAQVLIAAAQEIFFSLFPQLGDWLSTFLISRALGAAMLFVSIYLLFASLTPAPYQRRRYPKWPGALLVTAWWVTVAFLLPRVLRTFFAYDLTYGSLAGVMIALFFFWLVGLGMVVGAELNAALAESPEERDMADQAAAGTVRVKQKSANEVEQGGGE